METKRIYCVVPRDLAGRLHDLLRAHFAERPEIEVVIERRHHERRIAAERRAGSEPVSRRSDEAASPAERRRIRNTGGRRIGDRRSALVPLDPDEHPELPRRARRHAERIAFFERLEPRGEAAEDADTARIVTRIQAGESDLFADLYMRYFDRVYAYLRALLNDRHEAEDICQQTFLEATVGIREYERRSQPFRSWLFVIARNHAVMRLRKQWRTDLVDPADLGTTEEVESAVGEEDLSALGWLSDPDLMLFVERLPLPQRQVLILRYLLDMKMGEIAEVLGRTTVDVRALHHRAVRFLERRLAAVGRRTSSGGSRARMHRCPRPANVLRARRFALH